MILAVHYKGRRIGSLTDDADGIFFEYDRDWLTSGLNLSPLHLARAVRKVLACAVDQSTPSSEVSQKSTRSPPFA